MLNEAPPAHEARKTRAYVRSILGPYRARLTIAVLAIFVSSSLALVPAFVIGYIVNSIINKDFSSIWIPLVAIVLAVALQAVLVRIGSEGVARAFGPALADLREAAISGALGSPTRRVEISGFGDVVARVSSDIDRISDVTKSLLAQVILSSCLIAVTVIGLIVADWRLAIAGAISIPIQILALRLYGRRAPELFREERAQQSAVVGAMLEPLRAGKTVRAFRLQSQHLGRIKRNLDLATSAEMATVQQFSRFILRLDLARFSGLAAVLALAAHLVSQKDVVVGSATTAALLFLQIFPPMTSLFAKLDDVQNGGVSLSRLVGFATLVNEAGTSKLAGGPVSVELHNVCFSYNIGARVVHDFNLTIGAGEHVALVGASGAGKTTVARIIAGELAPTSGSVKIGGIPVAELSRAVFRQTFMFVNQEPHIFAGRLEDDLLLARPDASEVDIRSALESVGAWPWVQRLTAGTDTLVGLTGEVLSPQQAQQLSLARLVLKKPQIAIIDEATADAGSVGASSLEDAIEAAISGKTALIVAHRLTQAIRADRVVVMEGGEIKQVGSHDSLLSKPGLYRRMWSTWEGGSSE